MFPVSRLKYQSMRQKEQNKPTERKQVNINKEKENKQSEVIERVRKDAGKTT